MEAPRRSFSCRSCGRCCNCIHRLTSRQAVECEAAAVLVSQPLFACCNWGGGTCSDNCFSVVSRSRHPAKVGNSCDRRGCCTRRANGHSNAAARYARENFAGSSQHRTWWRSGRWPVPLVVLVDEGIEFHPFLGALELQRIRGKAGLSGVPRHRSDNGNSG